MAVTGQPLGFAPSLETMLWEGQICSSELKLSVSHCTLTLGVLFQCLVFKDAGSLRHGT